MTKAPTPTEKSEKQRENIKNATKNFDYTTIADSLRTVSWSNSSHSTGVVKSVYERSTCQLTLQYSLNIVQLDPTRYQRKFLSKYSTTLIL